jgi:hypothetical protein
MRARRRIIASLTGNTVPARSRASTIFQVVSERVDISGSDPIAERVHRAIEIVPKPKFPIKAWNFDGSGRYATSNQFPERYLGHSPVRSRLAAPEAPRLDIVCASHFFSPCVLVIVHFILVR